MKNGVLNTFLDGCPNDTGDAKLHLWLTIVDFVDSFENNFKERLDMILALSADERNATD